MHLLDKPNCYLGKELERCRISLLCDPRVQTLDAPKCKRQFTRKFPLEQQAGKETGKTHTMPSSHHLVSLTEIFFDWIKGEVKEKNGLANSKMFLISDNFGREK